MAGGKKEQIIYSEKYKDDLYEYRHVFLPKYVAEKLPKNKLMTEDEWRSIGVTQSHGWEHYMIHVPEPHILLFRRELDYLAKFGDRPRPTVNRVPTVPTNVNTVQPMPLSTKAF